MANITIFVVLLVVYSRIFIKTRATFRVGLAVFAGMRMLHNRIAVYGYFPMAPLYSRELLPYFLGYNLPSCKNISLLKVAVWPQELKSTNAAL